MPSVRDILARKGGMVVWSSPDATVLDVARLMNERGIGGVMVCEASRLLGVFTERDLMRRVVAERRDPAATPLREVMTTDVLTTTPDTPIEACERLMTERRIRHLPVIGTDGLAGVITTGDLLAYRVAEQADTIQHLHGYVFDVR
jgi:CBS domain-containing protein